MGEVEATFICRRNEPKPLRPGKVTVDTALRLDSLKGRLVIDSRPKYATKDFRFLSSPVLH